MVGVKLHADGGFFSDSSDGVFFDLDFSRFSYSESSVCQCMRFCVTGPASDLRAVSLV